MKKPKHTPGPLSISGNDDLICRGKGLSHGFKTPVAQVLDGCYGSRISIEEMTANKFLFAAAPDAYDLISKLRRFFREVDLDEDGEEILREINVWLKKATNQK